MFEAENKIGVSPGRPEGPKMIARNPSVASPAARERGSNRPRGETGGSGVRGVVGHPGASVPILAIDPGSHSGLTGWTSAIVYAAAVEIPARLPRAVMIPALQAALDAMGNPDPATVRVVIEGWLNPRGIPAVKSLHRCKEAWLDAAAELGIDHTSEVESGDWQRAMGCTGESENRKLVSRCIAAPVLRTAGLPCPADDRDLDENVADATCLGLWWVEEHRFGGSARVLATDGKKVSKAARAASAPRRGGFTADDLKAFQARGLA